MSLDIQSFLSKGAASNPYGAAANAITGLASGGPSSASADGDDSITNGMISIGGNGYASDPAKAPSKFLTYEYMGVPAFVWLGAMAMVAAIGLRAGR